MIRHIPLDKTNTIIKGSRSNLGLNPILKLNYGADVTRGLIHFDMGEIEKMYREGDLNLSGSTFTLKMTNCMSVDSHEYEKEIVTNGRVTAKRASAVDLILIRLPQPFDMGRGYDFSSDFWITGEKAYSDSPSNWYFSTNGQVWEADKNKFDLESGAIDWDHIISDYDLDGGIYALDYIESQYYRYLDGEDTIVVGTQHLDFGNENLSIDISAYVKNILEGKENNNGLCLMFTPILEDTVTKRSNYVGFFTDNTNTFFHPYVEVTCNNTISDDRNTFVKGRTNSLYFYSNVDGIPCNLDKLPVCTIDDKEYEVEQVQKGVYCARISPFGPEVDDYTIMIDKWSGITLNGVEMDDVEMEFVVLPAAMRISLGKTGTDTTKGVPSIEGIDDDEALYRDEVRQVTVNFREKYTTDRKLVCFNADYRIYVNDGNRNREYEVIPYTRMDRSESDSYFVIHAGDLIPGKYFVDIRVMDGKNIAYHKKVLTFFVNSQMKERYE